VDGGDLLRTDWNLVASHYCCTQRPQKDKALRSVLEQLFTRWFNGRVEDNNHAENRNRQDVQHHCKRRGGQLKNGKEGRQTISQTLSPLHDLLGISPIDLPEISLIKMAAKNIRTLGTPAAHTIEDIANRFISWIVSIKSVWVRSDGISHVPALRLPLYALGQLSIETSSIPE
jgi:hypothetical protein